MISPQLVRRILEDYALPLDGFHGVSHWARVLENGLRLAERTGAKSEVVQLFAVFHDCRRVTEGWDPEHGKRGADVAAALRGEFFDLRDDDFDLLFEACAHHTDCRTHDDVTVQTCWDTDRLDLGRVGLMVDRSYLSTPAAKDWETILWAEERSARRSVPKFVRDPWGLDLEEEESR